MKDWKITASRGEQTGNILDFTSPLSIGLDCRPGIKRKFNGVEGLATAATSLLMKVKSHFSF